MSFDGNILRHIVNELNNEIVTGRINKVYQLSDFDFLFLVHQKGDKKQLYLSLSPTYSRIHLTQMNYDKLANPPQFSMFLRKHIEGGIIKSISQVMNDRIADIEIDTRNELGDKVIKHLIIETMNKHANMIVTDDEYKILDALKKITAFESNQRTIYPGAFYENAETVQKSPYDISSREEFYHHPDLHTDVEIVKYFMGCSPQFAKEVMFRKEQNNLSMKDALESILFDFKPTFIQDNKDQFYYVDLISIPGKKSYYKTVNELVDRFYYERDNINIIKQRSKDLVKFVNNMIQRIKHKIEKLYKDLKKVDNAEEIRVKGELIQANLYQLKEKQQSITVLNYYTNQDETIILDPKLSPTKNSEKYFKKYKKLKNSIPHIENQIKVSKDELQYFETLLHQIENASLKDINEIKEELIDLKYLKGKELKKQQKSKPNIERFISDDGVEILVGKNNIQNQYITHKLAKKDEVWFHTKNAPGSHVLVRSPFPLSEDTIRFAAQLAAYFSTQKQSSSVPIDYVEVRYIKKVPGMIGSFVTYKNQKTIYIDPDEEYVISKQRDK